MKLTGLIVLACLIMGQSYGQYYYNDLVMTNEIAKKRAVLQQNRVRTVQMTSLDGNNQPVEGFNSEQAATSNYGTITTTTTTSLSGKNETTHSFNDKGLLIKTVDTSDGNRTVIEYTYDAAGQIAKILSRTYSPGNYVNKEEHLWNYNGGKPTSMWKVKNDRDTTYINFIADDKGNLGEEKSTHRGQAQPSVYYYYDDQNRLTDIVRYNARAKRLLPDFVFEYDASGRTSTMLVTNQGGADYQKWYYKYDDKGLKQQDICFGKNKSIIGKVQYTYK